MTTAERLYSKRVVADLRRVGYASHVRLLGAAVPPRRPARSLDAIVVPSRRTLDHLCAAIGLLHGRDSSLLVFTTGPADEGQARRAIPPELRDRVVIVEVPVDYRHPALDFSSSRQDELVLVPYADLSVKRNVALLLAKMLGWQSLLFLDDDVRGIDARRLDAGLALLRTNDAVGFKVDDFPDNSVVCHAHRVAGGTQETFVAGNALLVRTGVATAFFPDIYNEDWLFMWELLRDGRVTLAGKASQLPYDPFASTIKPAAQEFGDVIGEGLMSLLHLRVGRVEEDEWFWRGALQHRQSFMRDIAERLGAMRPGDRGVERATAAICNAMSRNEAISPRACSRFVSSWQRDLADWAANTMKLPHTASLEAALRWLDLRPANL